MEIINIDSLSSDTDKRILLKDWLRDTSIFLEFHYKSDFQNTKDLRDFVEIIGNELGFEMKQTSRMILICDELNNNAIEYGSKPGDLNIMRVRIVEMNNKKYFELQIEDSGNGKSTKKALDMETMRAHKLKRGYGKHNSIRGRGLFLITVQIAERLYFRNSDDRGLIVGVRIAIK